MYKKRKNLRLYIFALHPIMYQTPIFSTLQKSINKKKINLDFKVLFGDDLSLKKVFYKETQVFFKPDTKNLLTGYRKIFIKNFAFDSRSGFFSRLNFSILFYFFKDKPDLILIHGYETFTSWLALLCAKMFGVKVIWRGESVERKNLSPTKKLLKFFFLNIFFNFCDVVMYSCSGNKNFILNYFPHPNKLFFMPCAVDNNFFTSQCIKLLKTKNLLKSKLKIPKDDFVVLFCGRFTNRKRPKDLIEAAFKTGKKDITLLFVGDGPEKNNLIEMSKKLSVKSIFVGFKNQSEISSYYVISDLLVVISEYDPSPKVVNEAMNFNLPLILSREIGTSIDLVNDNRNGFLFDSGDTDNLANKIKFLSNNRRLSKLMGSYNRKLVSNWNYNANVDGLLKAIKYLERNA